MLRRKLISLLLLFILIFSSFASSVIAIQDYSVYIGRHEPGFDCDAGTTYGTNMVLEFTLDRGVVEGEQGKFFIDFEKDPADDNFNVLDSLDVSGDGGGIHVYNFNNDGDAPILHSMSDPGFDYNIVLDDPVEDYTEQTFLEITWAGGYGDEFTIGDVIRIYLGFSDTDSAVSSTDCVEGHTGVYDEASLPFNPPSTNYITLPQSGFDVFLSVEYGIAAGNFTEYKEQEEASVWTFNDVDSERVEFSAYNPLYLNLSLSDTAIYIPHIDHTALHTNTDLDIEVETNVFSGYTLWYKSTDFSESGGVSFTPVTGMEAISPGSGKMGFNFANPTDILGLAVLDAEYAVSNYYAMEVGVKDRIAINYGISHTIFTMRWGVSADELYPATVYTGEMTFYVFANF